jgi:hypothetical protein
MLWEIVKNAEAGKIDADYGGGVIKQRLARTGRSSYIAKRRRHISCTGFLRVNEPILTKRKCVRLRTWQK